MVRVLLLTLLLLPAPVWAHSGHDDSATHAPQVTEPAPSAEAMDFYGGGADAESPAVPEEDSAAGDMYGMGSGEGDHTMGHDSEPSLSGSDLLGDTMPDLAPSAPAGGGGDHAGHGMDNMPHVELAEHTAVSTDSKGYGAAVGITVLSGLLFGVLCMIRPFE